MRPTAKGRREKSFFSHKIALCGRLILGSFCWDGDHGEDISRWPMEHTVNGKRRKVPNSCAEKKNS